MILPIRYDVNNMTDAQLIEMSRILEQFKPRAQRNSVSAAVRNTIAILATVRGIATKIRTQMLDNPSPTAIKICQAVEDAATQAFMAYPTPGSRDMQIVHRCLTVWDRARIQPCTITQLTSTAVGLMTDLLYEPTDTAEGMAQRARIKDPVKREALEAVRRAVQAMHRHWDRKDTRWDEYRDATEDLRCWRVE